MAVEDKFSTFTSAPIVQVRPHRLRLSSTTYMRPRNSRVLHSCFSLIAGNIGKTRFEVFTNSQDWHHCHYCQLCIPVLLQIPLKFVP